MRAGCESVVHGSVVACRRQSKLAARGHTGARAGRGPHHGGEWAAPARCAGCARAARERRADVRAGSRLKHTCRSRQFLAKSPKTKIRAPSAVVFAPCFQFRPMGVVALRRVWISLRARKCNLSISCQRLVLHRSGFDGF